MNQLIIVSYKDRKEDRMGMKMGAVTKSSFDNDSLLNAVLDLISEQS